MVTVLSPECKMTLTYELEDIKTESVTESPDKKQTYLAKLLNGFSRLMDENARLVRTVPYVLATAGVLIIGRSIYACRKFSTLKDIPVGFITNNVRLQGCVRKISSDGVLHVEHIPMIALRLLQHNPGAPLLPVHVAGVDVLDPGVNWLEKNLHQQHIWFTLVAANKKAGVDCIIKTKKNSIFNMVVNDELIKHGLGTVVNFEQIPADNDTYTRLAEKLMALELTAEKRGKGVWKRPTVLERIKATPHNMKTKAVVTIGDIKQNTKSAVARNWYNIKQVFSWPFISRKKTDVDKTDADKTEKTQLPRDSECAKPKGLLGDNIKQPSLKWKIMTRAWRRLPHFKLTKTEELSESQKSTEPWHQKITSVLHVKKIKMPQVPKIKMKGLKLKKFKSSGVQDSEIEMKNKFGNSNRDKISQEEATGEISESDKNKK